MQTCYKMKKIQLPAFNSLSSLEILRQAMQTDFKHIIINIPILRTQKSNLTHSLILFGTTSGI